MNGKFKNSKKKNKKLFKLSIIISEDSMLADSLKKIMKTLIVDSPGAPTNKDLGITQLELFKNSIRILFHSSNKILLRLNNLMILVEDKL
jgi:hypothetical protein